MKKCFLLVFCLGIAIQVMAQQQYEFGFVAKVGNYTLPSSKTTFNTFGIIHNDFILKSRLGKQFTLGLWQSFRLGNHFRLSGELLYQNSITKVIEDGVLQFYNGSSYYVSYSKKIQEENKGRISIPLLLHFTLKKHGKFSMAIGAGLSRTTHSNVSEKQSNWFPDQDPIPDPRMNQYRYSNWENFPNTWNFLAGLHYRMDKKTMLGLEYNFEPKKIGRNLAFEYPNIECDCVSCDCSGYASILKSNLNSFSVSLRHNILD